jgi:hypothetical protein
MTHGSALRSIGNVPTPQSVLPILTSKRAPRELRLTCMSTFGEDIAVRCNHARCTVSKRGGNAYSSKKGHGRLLGDVFARKARRGRPWCDRGARSGSRTRVRFVFGILFYCKASAQIKISPNQRKNKGCVFIYFVFAVFHRFPVSFKVS